MERITFEERKRDAATIRPRAFMLDLSDGDITDFFRLAKEYGTTPERILQGFICDLIDGTQTHGSDERDPERILQGFICDLIDGTQTHGSDERDLAQQYIDRCSF